MTAMLKSLPAIFKIHGKELPLDEFMQYVDPKDRFENDHISIMIPTNISAVKKYHDYLMEGYTVVRAEGGNINLSRQNTGIVSNGCIHMWEKYKTYVKLRLNTELGRRMACEKLKDVDEAILRLERVFLNDPDYVRLLELRRESTELRKIISEPVK